MELFRKVFPDEFYKKFLNSGIRPDKRVLDEQRKITVSVGSITTAYGSSTVKMGKTSLICAIRGQIGIVPDSDAEMSVMDRGHLCVNLEMLPLCSRQIRTYKPSELTQFTSTILNRAVQDLLDTSDLITRDHSTTHGWYLFADLYCIEHDGNIMDTSLIAIIAALKNTKLPLIKFNENGEIFVTEEKTLELKLCHYPICISFIIFGNYVLIDPNLEEESLSEGKIHIVCNEKLILCDLIQQGLICATDESLLECLEQAKQKTKQILNLLEIPYTKY